MDVQQETSTSSMVDSNNKSLSSFEWFESDDVRKRYESVFKDYSTFVKASEIIRLLPEDNNITDNKKGTIRRIREEIGTIRINNINRISKEY